MTRKPQVTYSTLLTSDRRAAIIDNVIASQSLAGVCVTRERAEELMDEVLSNWEVREEAITRAIEGLVERRKA